MNSASQRPRNGKSAGLWNATSCWLIDWLRIVSIPPEQQIFPPWGGSFSDISAVPHFQQPGRGGNLRWGEQMAGSLLLSHTRTWLGHNITHISFRWRHFSVSTWGESRLLVIHYRQVSDMRIYSSPWFAGWRIVLKAVWKQLPAEFSFHWSSFPL